jgi:hypothetical protein
MFKILSRSIANVFDHFALQFEIFDASETPVASVIAKQRFLKLSLSRSTWKLAEQCEKFIFCAIDRTRNSITRGNCHVMLYILWTRSYG